MYIDTMELSKGVVANVAAKEQTTGPAMWPRHATWNNAMMISKATNSSPP